MPRIAHSATRAQKMLANTNTRMRARRIRSRNLPVAWTGPSDNPFVVGFVSILRILGMFSAYSRGQVFMLRGSFTSFRETRDSMTFMNYNLIDSSFCARFSFPLALFQAGTDVDVLAFVELHCDIG